MKKLLFLLSLTLLSTQHIGQQVEDFYWLIDNEIREAQKLHGEKIINNPIDYTARDSTTDLQVGFNDTISDQAILPKDRLIDKHMEAHWFPKDDTVWMTFPIKTGTTSIICINCYDESDTNKWKVYTGDSLMFLNRDHSIPDYVRGPFNRVTRNIGNKPATRDSIRGSMHNVRLMLTGDSLVIDYVHYIGVGVEKPNNPVVFISVPDQSDLFDISNGLYRSGDGFSGVFEVPGIFPPMPIAFSNNYDIMAGFALKKVLGIPKHLYKTAVTLWIDQGDTSYKQFEGNLHTSGGRSLIYEQKGLRVKRRKSHYITGNPNWNLYGEGVEEIKEFKLRTGGSSNREGYIDDALANDLILPIGMGTRNVIHFEFINGIPWGSTYISERVSKEWVAKKHNVDDDDVVYLRANAFPNCLPTVPGFTGIHANRELLDSIDMGSKKFSFITLDSTSWCTVGNVKAGRDSTFGLAIYKILQKDKAGQTIGSSANDFDWKSLRDDVLTHEFFFISDFGTHNSGAYRIKDNPKWHWKSDDFDNTFNHVKTSYWDFMIRDSLESLLHSTFRVFMREEYYQLDLIRRSQDLQNTIFQPSVTIPRAQDRINEYLVDFDLHHDTWFPNGAHSNWAIVYGFKYIPFLQKRPHQVKQYLADEFMPDRGYIPDSQNVITINLDDAQNFCSCDVKVSVNSLLIDANWSGSYYPYPSVLVELEPLPEGYTFVKWAELKMGIGPEIEIFPNSNMMLTPIIHKDGKDSRKPRETE